MYMADPFNENEQQWSAEEDDFKSKSQLKRESEAAQKLGQELVELTDASLAKLPLDDELVDAVKLAGRINRKKDGYRRQLQFIGKLMRSRDLQPIEEALARLKAPHQQATNQFHKLEQARDQILSQGDDAIQALLLEHPQLDRQKLRQFARQASKEQQQNKPPKAARELFKYLKQQIGE